MPHRVIAGRLLDGDGLIITHRRVEVAIEIPGWNISSEYTWTVETDEDGGFIAELEPDWPRAPEYLLLSLNLAEDPPNARAADFMIEFDVWERIDLGDVVLPLAEVLARGRVLDEAEQVIPGTRLEITSRVRRDTLDDEVEYLFPKTTLQVDAGGRFTIYDMPDCPAVSMMVTAPGMEREFFGLEEGPSDFEIRLRPEKKSGFRLRLHWKEERGLSMIRLLVTRIGYASDDLRVEAESRGATWARFETVLPATSQELFVWFKDAEGEVIQRIRQVNLKSGEVLDLGEIALED